jgi:hypothetical protein
MKFSTSPWVLGLLASLAVGCSWNRFTELKKDAPVVRLEPSDSHSGAFGIALAVAENDKSAELYVAGKEYAEGGLVYSLGAEEDPQPNPTDENHCPGRDGLDRCSAVQRPVGLDVAMSRTGEHELCFISGFGTIDGQEGLWTRCADNFRFVYPVPSDVRALLGAPRADGARGLKLANNRGPDQLVVAVTQGHARAWFYEPLGNVPLDLVTPTDAGADFGDSVAVAHVQDGHLVAIAASAAAEVWLYLVVGDVATQLGCLTGPPGFGRELASGDVDGDGEQDLVIASEDEITIHSGATLAASTPAGAAGSCSERAVLDDGFLAELTCRSTEETSGCGASDFGASLIVADVDGDGAGEIFVGAPRMAVREVTRAGAVLAYDSDGDFLQVQIVSDPEEKDAFGTSLAAVGQGGRDIVAVGAEGEGSAYLLYCAGKSDGGGSPRCR